MAEKLCIECNWSKKAGGFIFKHIPPIVIKCTHPIVSPPPTASLVTGKMPPPYYKYCDNARNERDLLNKDRCGREGRYWEPKK